MKGVVFWIQCIKHTDYNLGFIWNSSWLCDPVISLICLCFSPYRLPCVQYYLDNHTRSVGRYHGYLMFPPLLGDRRLLQYVFIYVSEPTSPTTPYNPGDVTVPANRP